MSAEPLSIDIARVPFSRYGSHWAISRLEAPAVDPPGVFLRHIYAGNATPVFRIELLDGDQPVEGVASATPSMLTLRHGSGYAEIILPVADQIRLRTVGVGLRLTAVRQTSTQWGIMIPAGEGRWRAILGGSKLLFSALHGTVTVTAPWAPMLSARYGHHRCDPILAELSPNGDLLLCGYESECDPPDSVDSFAESATRVEKSFESWRDGCPVAPSQWSAARDLATYVLWSSVVPPSGHYPMPVILMSKRAMVNLWNWDHYINAWGQSLRDPAFAWQMFKLYFLHQHACGALADSLSQNAVRWVYTKPPVHGWILLRMLESGLVLNPEEQEWLYGPLCRWTEWWFRYRDDDQDGICQYHHGNDSGWDDATAFDAGAPTETPDLSALLVLQMDALTILAERTGRAAEAAQWRRRADELLERFLAHSWRENAFVSMVSGTHVVSTTGDSLLNFIPLVLGRRLPPDIRRCLIEGLFREGRFLTEWGLASESLDSPEFRREGYWRGAIWPPPLLFVVDGLLDAGEDARGRELIERYARLVATHGFGENHDAVTGEPHYDTAYTWSASIFLILLNRLK